MNEFDYITVDAGSAGCVLAHRLSESGRHRVLLLEAGVSNVSADLHPLCATFPRAGDELGLPRSPDFNRPIHQGIGLYQITTRDGLRMPSARAYLHPAMKRPSLRVEIDALAVRRRFEGSRAVALDYVQRGTRPVMSPDPFAGFLLSALPCRPTSIFDRNILAASPLACQTSAVDDAVESRRARRMSTIARAVE